MAVPTLNIVTLREDKYILELLVNILPDGDTDYASVMLADASTFAVGLTPSEFVITEIHSDVAGVICVLEWDATSNTTAIVMGEGDSSIPAYQIPYGIPNNAGSGKTGDLCLTTTGIGTGKGGFIILDLKKVT